MLLRILAELDQYAVGRLGVQEDHLGPVRPVRGLLAGERHPLGLQFRAGGVNVFHLKGKVLAFANWRRACTDFHRVGEVSSQRCVESDTILGSSLEEGQDFTIYKCRNGMTEAASPVIIDGKHLANIFIGQFHLQEPDLDFFRRQAQEHGFDQADYLASIKEVPIMSEAKLPSILGFLSGFAKMVGSLSLDRIRASQATEDIKRRAEELRRSQAAALSLAEDAEMARSEIARYGDHLEQLVKDRTEELRASEERTRLLLESVDEGVIGASVDGEMTFINPAACRMLGYSPDEFEGKELHSLIHYRSEERRVGKECRSRWSPYH